MTIILFLVDTSASMCQKAYVNGVQKSYLDIAKGAVETFLKYRQRSQDCMGDRYMLLTFEDPPSNVKAGWKENHGTFMNELKNLQSNGLTSMGEALRNAFDLLNLNRMQSGIDTYGQGRCPFYLEPSVIIVITDGGKYSFKNGVHQEIILPLNTQTTGAKLTKEPFRWDQRLFSLVLRMAGHRVDERIEGKVPHDDSPIEKMCEVTGGRSYRIRTHHVLNQCIESLVQKVQPGVVVHFEPLMAKDLKDGEIQDIAVGTTKRMIYVQKHPTQKTFPVGFWPIPEPYWPDSKATILPPRDAHPRIRIITPCVDEPPLVRNFPVDKYEVEPSPLTLQILSKRESTRCWPVFVSNGIHGLELPFGYLKANLTFTQVHLVILPYNYLTLLPLLADLFHKFGLNPPSEWVYKFSTYVRSIPQYYGPFLRRALASASVPFQLLQYILPENLDSYLSPTVANYLKTMKNNAKQEQENMCLRVFKQLKLPRPAFHQLEVAKLNCGLPLKRDFVSHPQLKEIFTKHHSEINQFEAYTIVLPTNQQQPAAKSYRNPFDVPRHQLLDEIARMRENFLRLPTHSGVLFKRDAGHVLPISDMGNYQEYLKNKQTPLREIEPTNVRQHMFGNPYKKDKHMVMVDEADVSEVAPMKMQGGGGGGGNGGNGGGPGQMGLPGQLLLKKEASRPRKRKPGAIHRDYVFKRKYSDSDSEQGSSYCGSPAPSCSSSTMDGTMDDDNVSMAGSVADSVSMTGSSDDDEHDLVIDFTDEPMDEFFENGHVQDFINGSGEDADEPVEPAEPPPAQPTATPLHIPALLHHHPQHQHHHHPVVPAVASLAIGLPTSGSAAAAAVPSFYTPIVAAAAAGPPSSLPIIMSGIHHTVPSMGSNGITPLMPTIALQSALPPAIAISPSAMLLPGILSTTSPATLHSTAAAVSVPFPSPASGATSATAAATSSIIITPATSTTTAAAAASTASGMQQQHNQNGPAPYDYAAQEISKILHQCTSTNGSMDQSRLHHHHHHHHHHQHAPTNSSSSNNSANNRPEAAIPEPSGAYVPTNAGDTTNDHHLQGPADDHRPSATTVTGTNNHRRPSTSAAAATNNASSGAPKRSKRLRCTSGGSDTTSSNNHPAAAVAAVKDENSSDSSASDPANPANDAAAALLNDDDLKESVRQSNREARGVIFKDIRRPGRDYSMLLDHLGLVRGSLETRFTFIQMCIGESMRFRRKKMAETIQDWWDRQIDLT